MADDHTHLFIKVNNRIKTNVAFSNLICHVTAFTREFDIKGNQRYHCLHKLDMTVHMLSKYAAIENEYQETTSIFTKYPEGKYLVILLSPTVIPLQFIVFPLTLWRYHEK